MTSDTIDTYTKRVSPFPFPRHTSSRYPSWSSFPATRTGAQPPVTPQLLPAFPQGRLGAPATAPAYQEAPAPLTPANPGRVFPTAPSHPRTGQGPEAAPQGRAGRHQPPSVPPAERGRQGVLQKTGTCRRMRTYCWREFSIHGPVTAFLVSAWRGCLVVASSYRPRTELRVVPHPGLVYCWVSVVFYTSLSSVYLFPAVASTGKTRFPSKSYPTFQIARCHNLRKFGVI